MYVLYVVYVYFILLYSAMFNAPQNLPVTEGENRFLLQGYALRKEEEICMLSFK